MTDEVEKVEPVETEASKPEPEGINKRLVEIMGDNQSLKQDLRESKIAYQELEQERKFQAAKATELQEILGSIKNGGAEEKLVSKSLQIAELSMQIDRLNLQLRELEKDRQLMNEEREANVEMMGQLSDIIRMQKKQIDSRDNCDSDVNFSGPNGEEKDLRKQLESMRQERDMFEQKCNDLQGKIGALMHKNSEREVKNLLSLRQMRQNMDEMEDECHKKNLVVAALEGKVDHLQREVSLRDQKIMVFEGQFHIVKSRNTVPSSSEDLSKKLENLDARFGLESPTAAKNETRDDITITSGEGIVEDLSQTASMTTRSTSEFHDDVSSDLFEITRLAI